MNGFFKKSPNCFPESRYKCLQLYQAAARRRFNSSLPYQLRTVDPEPFSEENLSFTQIPFPVPDE